MRWWMNLIESAQEISEGDYGFDHWWITPDGRVRVVDDHHSAASAEFGNDEYDDEDPENVDDYTSAVRSALAAGWVRASLGGEVNSVFSASWMPGGPTPDRSFRALSRLIGKLPEASEYRMMGRVLHSRREALALLTN